MLFIFCVVLLNYSVYAHLCAFGFHAFYTSPFYFETKPESTLIHGYLGFDSFIIFIINIKMVICSWNTRTLNYHCLFPINYGRCVLLGEFSQLRVPKSEAIYYGP